MGSISGGSNSLSCGMQYKGGLSPPFFLALFLVSWSNHLPMLLFTVEEVQEWPAEKVRGKIANSLPSGFKLSVVRGEGSTWTASVLDQDDSSLYTHWGVDERLVLLSVLGWLESFLSPQTPDTSPWRTQGFVEPVPVHVGRSPRIPGDLDPEELSQIFKRKQ